MSSFADDINFILFLSRCANNNLARCAFAVQRIANVCTQLGLVHAARAVYTALLTDSEENLNCTMRSAFLQQQADAL